MRIAVKLFALYRELTGTATVTVELPPNATVADLCREIRRRFPTLPQEPYPLVTAVNQEYVDEGHLLRDGDEAALIPPVSGGAC